MIRFLLSILTGLGGTAGLTGLGATAGLGLLGLGLNTTGLPVKGTAVELFLVKD